jgi:hypothetical protein
LSPFFTTRKLSHHSAKSEKINSSTELTDSSRHNALAINAKLLSLGRWQARNRPFIPAFKFRLAGPDLRRKP